MKNKQTTNYYHRKNIIAQIYIVGFAIHIYIYTQIIMDFNCDLIKLVENIAIKFHLLLGCFEYARHSDGTR